MLRGCRYAFFLLTGLLAAVAVHESGRPLLTAATEYALDFDGVDDRVTFGPAPALGAQTFTLELWFRRTGSGVSTTTGTGGVTAVPLLTKGRNEGTVEGTNLDLNYFLGIDQSTRVLVADFEDMFNGANHPVRGRTAICDNVWYHAAATYDVTTGTWRLYLNGELEAELIVPAGADPRVREPRSDSIQHAALATAMTSTGTPAGFFRGQIDEARVWNVARTQDEIKEAMGGPLLVGLGGLVGRWGLDEGTGTIANSSVGAVQGTLQPAAPALPPTWSPGGSGYTPTPLSSVNNGLSLRIPGDFVPLEQGPYPLASPTPLGASTFTIETWFRRDGLGVSLNTGAGGIASVIPMVSKGRAQGEGTNTDINYLLGINTVGGGAVLAADFEEGPGLAAGLNHAISGVTPIATGTWYHGAVTYDGKDLQLYLNGLPEGSPITVNRPPRFDSIMPAALGSALDAGGNAAGVFTGTLDETRIWNYARTPAEVLDGYQREIKTAAGLLGRWGFDELCGCVLDATGRLPKTAPRGPGWSWVPTPSLAVNAPPVVNAGADATFVYPGGLLTGTVSDDGDPAAVTTTWSKSTGPGEVIFANANLLSTNATFSGVGTYELLLTATDGTNTASDTVTIHVVAGDINVAPTVLAGPDQPIELPAAATLAGIVGDDGLPPGGAVTSTWTMVSGLGTVAFADAHAASTTATFSAAGTYVLRLSATDGDLSASDDVTIIVNEGPGSNHAPGLPALVAPENGAPRVRGPVTLKVSAADAEGDALRVTYYGRPKPADVRGDFTLVTIPDTRHYTASAANAATFAAQTNWIVSNVGPLNVKFVSHLGDIVDNHQLEVQWQRADASIAPLDVHKVPYGLAPGERDQSAGGVATFYDKYFPLSRFIGNEWFGGYLGAEPTDFLNRLNKDSYQLFSSGGIDFLVIHIEHDWPGYAVTWADRIIKRHPNRRVILVSNLFLNELGNRPLAAPFRGVNGTSAETVWQNLVRPNCNVVMVISSHYPGESRRTDPNACGQPVHQVMTDYERRANGGNGWLRYYVFQPSRNTIAAFTYSPTLNQFEEDADSQFQLELNMGGVPFSVIATESNVPSGGQSSVTWPGLAANTQYEWYATVSDGRKTTTGPMWSFTTAPPNVAPAAHDDGYEVDEDNASIVPAPGVLGNDTDADGDPLTAVLVSGPSHGSLVAKPDGSFTYEPVADYHGPDSFTYKASDGLAESNVATVTMTVRPVNDAPVAANDTFAVDEDQTLGVAPRGVLANDTDVDGAGVLEAVLVSGASNGTVTLNATGGFVYAPNRDFNGTDAFTYRASDGEALSNTATVTIVVSPVNDAPIAVDDRVTTDEDVTLAGSVVGNDTDVDNTALSAILVTGPGSGSLTLGGDGRFSYAPAANFSGTASFTYRVTDGHTESNTAAVFITILPVNDPPVANSQALITEKKRPVAVTLTARDQEGSALTYRIVRGPLNGTLTGTAPNLQYTPNKKFLGVDRFTFVASDGTADSAVATVAIAVVEDIDDPPTAYDRSARVDQSKTEEIELRAKDPEDNRLTYVIVSAPTNGTLSGSGKNVKYTSNTRFRGEDRFTFKVSDTVHESNVATVTITVKADDDPEYEINSAD